MRKFILKILLLASCVVLADFFVGVLCRYFQYHTQGGDTGRMMYIADKMEEEVLIFGSSRAMHHYDPRILADSLGLSCYNCGRDGNGIIFCYGMYRLFRDRYVPRVIIYDIQSGFDLEEQHDNEKYLNWLRYFYDRPGIDSIFWSVDMTERWKMRSRMRQYNERFVQLVSDYYHPQQKDIKGYRPLGGVMSYEPEESKDADVETYEYNELKLQYFHQLIKDCKSNGTVLILMVSPKYWAHPTSVFNPIKELARREGVPFFYHYDDLEVSNMRQYFKDSWHMNEDGAEAYTRKIVPEIRKCL